MDSEESRENIKRQKIIFKKLLFLNTARMLDVLKYKATNGDRKKLVHSLKTSA